MEFVKNRVKALKITDEYVKKKIEDNKVNEEKDDSATIKKKMAEMKTLQADLENKISVANTEAKNASIEKGRIAFLITEQSEALEEALKSEKAEK